MTFRSTGMRHRREDITSLHLRFCCSTSRLLYTWVTCAHNATVEVVYTCLSLFGSMFEFADAVRRSMCTNYGKKSWRQRTTIDFSQCFFRRSCDVWCITALGAVSQKPLQIWLQKKAVLEIQLKTKRVLELGDIPAQ